jgi:pimeloyl-ACP methyl ester carboxylesterase
MKCEILSEKILDVYDHQCRCIYNLGSGLPVVFLHGFSFTSDVWQHISLTTNLIEKQVPFLALDMPYGLKSMCKPKTRNTEVNVTVVREGVQQVFNSEKPVLVGASLGGYVALQYAARFPVKGLLLVAPVRAFEGAIANSYKQSKFPVHIIIGSEDKLISIEQIRELATIIANAKLKVYEHAGHPAYLDSPKRFKQDLLEFYATAEN